MQLIKQQTTSKISPDIPTSEGLLKEGGDENNLSVKHLLNANFPWVFSVILLGVRNDKGMTPCPALSSPRKERYN